MTLAEILKDSNYKLTQFSIDKIKSFEESIIIRKINDKEIPYSNLFGINSPPLAANRKDSRIPRPLAAG